MRVGLFAIMFMVAIIAKGQTLIGVASNFSLADGTSVSWSIGEPVIGTLSANDQIVTMGFQQVTTRKLLVGIEDVHPEGFKIFPNPATKWITMRAPPSSKQTRIQICNSAGQIVLEEAIIGCDQEFSVDIGQLSSGMYLLFIRDGNSFLASSRFIKL